MRYATLGWVTTISLTFLAGCGGGNKSRPVTLMFLAGGKPVLNPLKDEVVKWVGPDGKTPVTVNFPIASPCKEGSSTSTCTMQLQGFFPYDCKHCSDPGVAVGSDFLEKLGQTTLASTAVADAQVGYVFCDMGTKAAKVYQDPLSASASASGGDSTVQWLPLGGSGIMKYTIGLQSGTCKESTVDQSQDVCTLVAGASSQTYSVTADACSAGGTASLTIR
jgi:hypothetical protein